MGFDYVCEVEHHILEEYRHSSAPEIVPAAAGRQIEVLNLIAEGWRNAKMAAAPTITSGTVNRHIENIFDKMGVTSRAEAVVRAVENGVVILTETQARSREFRTSRSVPA